MTLATNSYDFKKTGRVRFIALLALVLFASTVLWLLLPDSRLSSAIALARPASGRAGIVSVKTGAGVVAVPVVAEELIPLN